MAASLFDTAPATVDAGGRRFSSYAGARDFTSRRPQMLTGAVGVAEAFRPDLVAWRLWGRADLSWALDEMNGFEHGVREYAANTTFLYLDRVVMQSMALV